MESGDSSGDGCDSHRYRSSDDKVREFAAYGRNNCLSDGSFGDVSRV